MSTAIETSPGIKTLLETCSDAEIARATPEQREPLRKCLNGLVQSILRHAKSLPGGMVDLKLIEPIDRNLAEEVVCLDAKADELAILIKKKRESIPEFVEQSIAAQLKALEDSVLGDIEITTNEHDPIKDIEQNDASTLDVEQMDSLRSKFAEISEKVNKFAEVLPTVVKDTQSAMESASKVLSMPTTATDNAISATTRASVEQVHSDKSQSVENTNRSDGTVLAKRLARNLGATSEATGSGNPGPTLKKQRT